MHRRRTPHACRHSTSRDAYARRRAYASWALACGMLVVGCGPVTVRETSSEPSAVAGLPPAIAPPTGETPSSGSPTGTEAPEAIDPTLACSGPGDCTGSHYATPPRSEADCACRTCARHVLALAGLRAISEAERRVCAAFYRTQDCPPVVCAEPTTRPSCVRGACVAAPVAEADEPSPCRSPAECPRGGACVTAALGGEIGCTNETCCGAAECANGCADDGDCPACRPSCLRGACRDPNGAM